MVVGKNSKRMKARRVRRLKCFIVEKKNKKKKGEEKNFRWQVVKA
jgi:hypothetical protein